MRLLLIISIYLTDNESKPHYKESRYIGIYDSKQFPFHFNECMFKCLSFGLINIEKDNTGGFKFCDNVSHVNMV